MDFYAKYTSPLGYQTGENDIDSYGVDHSGFTTRDEVEYQLARQEKENQLIKNYNKQGITKNYPQYGTHFWGKPDNNYGFGFSNIHDNIVKRNNNPFKNTMNTFGQKQSVWNKNQYQTPMPGAKQSSGFENTQPMQAKPVYENPNHRHCSTGEILWDGVKGCTSTIIDEAIYPATTVGELIADVVIAKDYYDQMHKTGKKLVSIYGSGQATNIDNYYHPLLQCQLSKISPDSQRNGILLGYAKEGWDYFKKILNNQSHGYGKNFSISLT